jgi:hypothetical protein
VIGKQGGNPRQNLTANRYVALNLHNENSITQRNKSKIIDLLYGSKKVQKVKFKGTSNYRNITWRK